MTDHTDLIARAESYVRPEQGMPKDSPNYDLVRKLVAALADSVPREQMTADQFREAVGLERASHAARGYDEAHDRAHGVVHLLGWAIDYAARGEAVKSGSLIVAALSVSSSLEREERALRADRDALAHVIEQVRAARDVDEVHGPNGRVLVEITYDESAVDAALTAAPTVSLARHDAEVKAQLLTELADEEMQTNGATMQLERLLSRAAEIRAEAEVQ